MSDWADEEAVNVQMEARMADDSMPYLTEWHLERIATALRAAERRGRIAGLREAAEIANTVGQSPPAQMRLQAGECTAQEIRTARVFVCLAETRIRARANALEASE